MSHKKNIINFGVLCCPPLPTLPLPRKTQNVLAAPPSLSRSSTTFQCFHPYYPHPIVFHLYYRSVILSCHLVIHITTNQIRLHMDNIYVIKLITIKLFNYEQCTKLSQCIKCNIHYNSIITIHIYCVYNNTKLIR